MEIKMNTNELCNNKYQIFCDLDGVLVDLIQGVENAILCDASEGVSERYLKKQRLAKEALGGATLKECYLKKDDIAFKKPVRDFMYKAMNADRHFWMNLPWKEDGKKLWDFIKSHEPIILSKPTDLQSVIGKKAWVKQNLGLNKENVQIRMNKAPYAQFKGKTGLLIDDYHKNITAFSENGGETIHYKNVDDAIGKLKEYGFTGKTA
jgi:hypothetical protein